MGTKMQYFLLIKIVLLSKSAADAVHNAVRKRNRALSAGSLSALPRGQACQQQPDMSASAYGCPRCAGARRGYHSTAEQQQQQQHVKRCVLYSSVCYAASSGCRSNKRWQQQCSRPAAIGCVFIGRRNSSGSSNVVCGHAGMAWPRGYRR
jgi:hypothetical protein